MTKDNKKLYDKAMDKFNNAEIEKALELCEQCIAEDLSNAPALNLKGLILYLKGRGEEARTTWETNKEYNDDEVAKNYLKSLEKDLPRLKAYEEATKKIEEFEINEGIEELEELTDSDFNLINVSNALTYAYIKKGEFELALKYNKKVLGYDKTNKLAVDYFKEIKTYYDVGDLKVDVKPNINYKLIGGIAAAVLAVGVGAFALTNINKNNDVKENPPIVQAEEEEVPNAEEKETPVKAFNVEAVKKAKSDENYKALSDEMEGIDVEKLSQDDAKLYKECKELLSRDGVEDFYSEGRKLYKAGDYKKAEEELKYAYMWSEESYLRQHIIYMLAANSEKAEDVDKAIKYYKEYIKDYESGEYTPECIYKLAMLNKEVNKSESKKYANMLKEKYSNNMYYNNNIKEILGEE